MTVRILPLPRWQFLTDDGSPANGYYVYTYEPGTTTNKATYSDSGGSTPNSNPIVLNSRGEAQIYWDGLYKVAIYTGDKDVDGSLVYQEDDYGVNVQIPVAGNYNRATNGDFESATADPTQPDDWTITTYTDGTVALDSTDQYSGANSLKFTSVGTGGGYAESVFFEVQEGKNLALNWAMKSSVADVRNVVEAIWYTSAQAQISTSTIYDDSATNPTSWTQKISKATPPSTARFCKLRLTGCHSSDSTVGNTWYDGILATVHADGDGSGLSADDIKGVGITTAQAVALATVPSTTMDGLADLSNAEIVLLDGSDSTNNIASKAVVLDSDKGIKLAADSPATPVADTLYADSLIKAWGNILGTGTPAATDSFNVSGISDLGTGNYRVTFTTAMSDANYAVITTSNTLTVNVYITNKASTYFEVVCEDYGGTNFYIRWYFAVLGAQ